MEIQSCITFCLLFAAAVSAALALYALRYLNMPGTKAYSALMTSVVFYCVGYALEINQTSAAGLLLALRVEYWGISFLPACWLLLAMRYAGYDGDWPRWLYGVLFLVPVGTLVLINTNSWHHLYYASFQIDTSGPFPMSAFEKGLWYQINAFYIHICFFAGNLLFFRMMIRSMGRSRKQAACMFFTSVIPWIGLFIYQAGLAPYRLDIVPFTFAIVGPLFAIGLFRFGIFDFIPIARHTVFEAMCDPVLVVDTAGRLADYNPAAAKMFPELAEGVIGRRLCQVLPLHQELLQFFADETLISAEMTIGAGAGLPVFHLSQIPIAGKGGEAVAHILIMHDITRQKQQLEIFQERARLDALTGIFNRGYFMERAERSMQYMLRNGHPFTLGILDLDHFKRINDQYGHLTGDDALRKAAQAFTAVLRDGDLLGRYGGEEFIFFLPETVPETGLHVAERLRQKLSSLSIASGDEAVHITASFGLTGRLPDDPEISLLELCKKADAALYQAKGAGRNRVVLLL